jgi:tetratricopeptide (TPR) repeat protein
MVLAARAQIAVGEMRSLAQYGVPARVMQAAYGLMFYLGKTVLPVHLSPLYPLRPDISPTAPVYLLCALAVGAVTLVLIRMRQRWPWALAAWACYVVVLSPVLGLVQSGPQLVADRYTYLACLPWALLLGAAVYRIPACHRSVVAVTSGVVLVVLSVLTFQQTRVWANGFTLWDYALSIDPSNYVADVNRGWLQLQRDDLDGALTYFEAALQANPRFALAYEDRGFVRHRRGDLQGAMRDYTTAIEIDPSPEAYFNRGVARQVLGDDDGAMADYTVALRTETPDPRIYSNRGYLRLKRGDWRGAIADYTASLEIDPSAEAYGNRALARHNVGDDDGAIADYNVAVRMEAPPPQAFSNRAMLRRARGDLAGAIEDFEKALQVAPADWPYRGTVEDDLKAAHAAIGRGSP